MKELRLVAAAALVWSVALAMILGAPVVALALVTLTVAGWCAVKQWGQALLCGVLGASAGIVAWARVRAAESFTLAREFTARVAAAPQELESGSWLTRVRVSGYPADIPVFSADDPGQVRAGADVLVSGSVGESGRAGMGSIVVNGSVDEAAGPKGWAAFSAHVRTTFAEAVESHVPEHSQGLIPGMVLGDTSLQSATEQEVYIATGLSHLSAVSGANVAIVTTAAVLFARALGAGLRVQVVGAGVAVVLFAALVGGEPSVLRATVTGLVGLVAVLSSSRAEPAHVLSLAIVVLVHVDSSLATNFGFALSVAATVGIIAVYPLLYRAFAPTGWPDILVRALAVAIAADVMTMPIIALMAGEVSLVSVAANVLVAPAAAPVTVLGLLAAIASVAPGGLEQLLFPLIQPWPWWIYTVGHTAASFPQATVSAQPVTVVVVYGWIMAGFVYHKARLTLAAVAIGFVLVVAPWQPTAEVVDVTQLRAHIVDDTASIEPIPPGTQVVVVRDGSGRPATRGTVTPSGIPVLYPNRDGPVTLRADNTQEFARGGL